MYSSGGWCPSSTCCPPAVLLLCSSNKTCWMNGMERLIAAYYKALQVSINIYIQYIMGDKRGRWLSFNAWSDPIVVW